MMKKLLTRIEEMIYTNIKGAEARALHGNRSQKSEKRKKV